MSLTARSRRNIKVFNQIKFGTARRKFTAPRKTRVDSLVNVYRKVKRREASNA